MPSVICRLMSTMGDVVERNPKALEHNRVRTNFRFRHQNLCESSERKFLYQIIRGCAKTKCWGLSSDIQIRVLGHRKSWTPYPLLYRNRRSRQPFLFKVSSVKKSILKCADCLSVCLSLSLLISRSFSLCLSLLFLSEHTALTCPECLCAWALAHSLVGELLAACKKSCPNIPVQASCHFDVGLSLRWNEKQMWFAHKVM